MVLQRQREQRNAQISYEQENGGSDPISPEFWDEDEEERALEARLEMSESYNSAGPSNHNQFQTPPRRSRYPTTIGEQGLEEPDEDDWADEAARAEEAEREAEEMEMARRVEDSYRQQQQQQDQSYHHRADTSIEVDDMDMDWDVDMDF